jgi:hypothetical protein
MTPLFSPIVYDLMMSLQHGMIEPDLTLVYPSIFPIYQRTNTAMKKKQDIQDFCSASEASLILSKKFGRYIRPDYIAKLSRRKKHPVRTYTMNDRILYHREDIAASTITQKRPA